MSLWKPGSLLTTRRDIAIDTLLSTAIVGAGIPQMIDSSGLSPLRCLPNTLFTTAQLSQTLFMAAYGYPSEREPVLEQIAEGKLQGWKALGGVYGVVQVGIDWGVAVVQLVVVSRESGRAMLITAALHAAIVLLPAAAIALPKPSRHEMGRDILMGFILIMNTYSSPILLTLQFYSQLHIRSLDARYLALQIPVKVLLARRWYLRLGGHSWGNLPASLWTWYSWGFHWMNYLAEATGYAGLLIWSSFGGLNGMRGEL